MQLFNKLVVLGLLLGTGVAQGAVLTFDSLVDNFTYYDPYTEAGYTLWFSDSSASSHSGDFGDGKREFAWHSASTYNIDMTLTKNDGGAFNLASLFLASGSDLGAMLVTDKGNFSFSGYGVNTLGIMGVSYVTFALSSDVCCSVGIAMDDVTVTGSVPAPGSLAAVIVGLLGMIYRLKRAPKPGRVSRV